MNPTANLDWLYLLGGWLIGGCAALLLLWSLFRDGGRKLRRCPKCWYDMSGTPGMQCPECGRTARNERKLHQTRRKWRFAALALVLGLTGYGIASVPGYQRGGWVALVPSSVLVFVAPAEADGTPGGWMRRTIIQYPTNWPRMVTVNDDTMTNETWKRLRASKLAHWQSQVFLGRYVKKQKLELIEHLSLPPRWPVGEAIPAQLGDDQFDGLDLFARGPDGWLPPPVVRVVGASAPGKTLKVELGLGAGALPLYRTVREMPIVIEGTRETLLEPRASAEDNDRVKAALNPHVSMNGFEPVVVLYDRSHQPEWDGIHFGIAYTFEVSLDGAVLLRGRGMAQWSKKPKRNWEEFAVPEPARAAVLSGRAVITIRGRRSDATDDYMSWPFDKPTAACWTGEFSQPLETRWHPGISKGD